MSRIASLVALSVIATALAAPTAAAQPLPDNPFEDFACAGGGGPGLLGYVRTIIGAACGAALFAGYVTYEFVCTLTGAC